MALKYKIFAPAAGKNHNVFRFMLVYRTPLDTHKTLNFGPPQARKNTLLGALLRGFTLKNSAPQMQEIYVSKLNPPNECPKPLFFRRVIMV